MHYKNGREARVGDPVVGTCFNTRDEKGDLRVIAGTFVSLTPGDDACSAMVGFLQTQGPKIFSLYDQRVVALQGDQSHGSSGQLTVTVYAQDYTECKYLLHADDAFPKE